MRTSQPKPLRGKAFVGLVLLMALAWPTGIAQAQTKQSIAKKSTETQFLDGLWARGYYDLADDYLAELKRQNKLSPQKLAWYDARSTFEEATSQIDLNRRRGLLEQAISKMSQAIGGMASQAEANEARLVQVRAMVELAHLVWVDSQDQPTQGQANVLLKQARDRLSDARQANNALITGLTAQEKSFKLPVLPDDPRRPDFEATQLDRLNSQLQSALIDYEEAQTWPDKSPQRNGNLEKAAAVLQKLYEDNRQQLAGQNARLWQAKCMQELGRLPEASGIYGELVDQADPALREIRRRAVYFRLLAYRDRGDFALAADEARRWLDTYPDQARTDDGLGVQLELARNILLQLPKAAPNEKAAGERMARDRLGSVVRVYSRHQAEARKLLNQFRKTAPAVNPARLDLTAALAAGQEALELKDWAQAERCFEAAAAKASDAKDNANYVKARYFQAVALFRADQYYEAYVLADHIARRYPSVPLASNAAEIGIAAMTYAYNLLKSVDPASDLKRLTDLAEYTAKTWPETSQADTSRLTLAEIARGQGRYDDAVKALSSVPASSEQLADAQAKLGLVLWRKSQKEAEIQSAEAPKTAGDAIVAFRKSLEIQSQKGVPEEDPKVLGTKLDLADALIVTGKPAEANAVLESADKVIKDAPAELQSRYRRTRVRGLIAADLLDQALQDLARAEAAGQSAEELSALYFQLGQSLQDEMKELQARSDGRLVRVRQSYQAFLKALAASKAGESWQALQWVAEAQLDDNQPAAALETLKRVESQYLQNESFSADPANAQRVIRTQLKLAEAARKTGQFPLASSTLKSLSAKNANLLPMMMEQGRLLEAQGKTNDAFAHWRTLATRLGGLTPRPPEYYDSWLEVARILEKQGKAATARQTLASILKLGGARIPAESRMKLEAELKRLPASSSASTTAVKKAGAK